VLLGTTVGNTLGTLWELERNILGTLWEPIGNLKGTFWELYGNPLGTWREHVGNKGKWKKKIPPTNPTPIPLSPPKKLKRKQIKALWVHVEPSHWLHEISISKTVHHHFSPGLITPIINWGYVFIYLFIYLVIQWHSQFSLKKID